MIPSTFIDWEPCCTVVKTYYTINANTTAFIYVHVAQASTLYINCHRCHGHEKNAIRPEKKKKTINTGSRHSYMATAENTTFRSAQSQLVAPFQQQFWDRYGRLRSRRMADYQTTNLRHNCT